MRIVFLVPPAGLNQQRSAVDRVYGCNYGFDYKPPVHLLLLATLARNAGYQVRLIDSPALGLDDKGMLRLLSVDGPQVVVFWSVWLSSQEDLRSAQLIAGKHPDCDFIFTGPYPTWKPELYLISGNHFVLRGEPEAALLELLEARVSGARFTQAANLSYLSGGRVINNMCRGLIELDTLPIPDRTLLKGKYSFNRLRMRPATVACFSRGCTYQCVYCAPHSLDQAIELEHAKGGSGKPPLRLRSSANVIAEFRMIRGLGYRALEICDNQFVWGRERVMDICAGICDLGMEWICYARADHLLDRKLLAMMRRAGCRLVFIGTDSFVQEILDDTRKGVSLSVMSEAVSALKEAGIEPEVSVLLGASRLETEETARRSIAGARRLKTRFVHYSIASPIPNTQLYRLARDKGWIRGGDFSPSDNVRNAQMDLPGITGERLEALVRRCYAAQYFSPRFILAQVLSGDIFRSPLAKLRSAIKLLRYTV